MTPETKCVSLETAKRLKAAGFPQETEREYRHTDVMEGVDDHLLVFSKQLIGCDVYDRIAAPDAQEIGEMLPRFVEIDGSEWWFEGGKDSGNSWYAAYSKEHEDGLTKVFFCESESEARAAAWLWLKEKGLV